MNREEYLIKSVELLTPLFEQYNYTVPKIKVSCGFPASGPLKNLGECWSDECSIDKETRNIFISPLHHITTLEVLGTLVHEMLHSVLPNDAKHGKLFKHGMKCIGLEGKPKSAGPNEELNNYIKNTIINVIGDYPQEPTLLIKTKLKKIRNKNIVTYRCDSDDFEVKINRKFLEQGIPHCYCNKEMVEKI